VIALVIALALLALLVVVLAAAVVALSVHASRLRERLDDVKSQSAARAKDAVAKSRSVHIGKIVEKVAPLLPEFPYSPKDTYWLGGPIDVIVFHRLEAGGDVEVVLLEVKTGNAHVEVAQRRIRDAVEAGRVRFGVFRHRPDDVYLPNTEDLVFADDELVAEEITAEEPLPGTPPDLSPKPAD
jgi:predicted Holliday junction resolvase-like endonuclease